MIVHALEDGVMQAGFISTSDARWHDSLKSLPHDIYHLPAYIEADARRIGAEPIAFYGQFEGKILFVPLLLRELPEVLDAPSTWRDAISPYGYASPLITHDVSDIQEKLLWQAFLDLCREKSIVTVFMRLHPLLKLPSTTGDLHAGILYEGETVFIDLTLTQEDLRRQFRENHRRGINKLEKNGFKTVIDDWGYLDDFIDLYWETMNRVGADGSYLFPCEYFLELKRLGRDSVHLCTVLSPQGNVAASGLFFTHDSIVQFHLSGTAYDFLPVAPTKLMFSYVAHWAKQRGATKFHLGGGVNCQNDSLFVFKAGFSKSRCSFATLRLICDHKRYAELISSPSTGEHCLNTKGYFPAYRQISQGTHSLVKRPSPTHEHVLHQGV
jgi:hypothetical protein